MMGSSKFKKGYRYLFLMEKYIAWCESVHIVPKGEYNRCMGVEFIASENETHMIGEIPISPKWCVELGAAEDQKPDKIRDRSYFTNALKTAGQMLINRAEELIGNIDKCFDIHIVIDILPMENPTMEINRCLYVIPDQSGSGEEE